MKLKDCQFGIFVKENIEKIYLEEDRPKKARIGHITGVTENSIKEVILMVRWMDGEESNIHPDNVEKI